MNRTDGAIVRVITGITGDSPDAEQQAQTRALRFINDLLPQLDAYLPKYKSRGSDDTRQLVPHLCLP